MLYKHRGKFFEDFDVGEEFLTPARTVTENDIISFASLSADWNPLHTDDEFAKKAQFGGRIAHGLISVAIALGLIDKIGIIEGTAQAFLEIAWKFTGPVKPCDTISARVTVRDKRLTRRGDRGIVTFDINMYNQNDMVVSEGDVQIMVTCRQ